MNLETPRFGRALLAISVMAALAIGAALPVLADSSSGTATVTAGSLTETAQATFSTSVTLNGADQTATYTLPITVIDATGSGAGWNLTVSSTTFTTGSHSLDPNASKITGVTSACAAGATCSNPTNNVSYTSLTLPSGNSVTAVKMFNAAANTGMGKFAITPTVAISIPANAFAGTYNSTVTVTVASAP